MPIRAIEVPIAMRRSEERLRPSWEQLSKHFVFAKVAEALEANREHPANGDAPGSTSASPVMRYSVSFAARSAGE